jgi:CRP-like cAMP-binding protein
MMIFATSWRGGRVPCKRNTSQNRSGVSHFQIALSPIAFLVYLRYDYANDTFFSQEEMGMHNLSFADLCLEHEIYGRYLRYETYKTSSIIYSLGDPIDAFGIVVEGILKAETDTLNGEEMCSAYFEERDVFPEFLYFSGRRKFTYNLVAAKRSTVAWMPAATFERMIEEDTDMMYSLLLYISQRGLKNQLYLSCLNYQTIRQRVAFWLVGMDHLYENGGFPLPGSQTVWANKLHVSRSSLNQELKKMEELGYFRRYSRRLEILDQEGLEALL